MDRDFVRDENGNPLIVLHGTTRDFNRFKRVKKVQNTNNFFGTGFYFSDSPLDVATNYATLDGPDLKNQIDNAIEQYLANECDRKLILTNYKNYYNISDPCNALQKEYDMLVEIFTKKLMVQFPKTIPALLKMKNPLILDDPERSSNKATHIYRVQRLFNAIKRACAKLHINSDNFIYELYNDDVIMDGYFSFDYFIKKLLRSYNIVDFDLPSGVILKEIIKQLGYDGIIMNAGKYFPHMKGVSPNTKHYVVFNPKQIVPALQNPQIKGKMKTAVTQMIIKLAKTLDTHGCYSLVDYIDKNVV